MDCGGERREKASLFMNLIVLAIAPQSSGAKSGKAFLQTLGFWVAKSGSLASRTQDVIGHWETKVTTQDF